MELDGELLICDLGDIWLLSMFNLISCTIKVALCHCVVVLWILQSVDTYFFPDLWLALDQELMNMDVAPMEDLGFSLFVVWDDVWI